MWSVLMIWFQLFELACPAREYQMESSTSSLVFIVDVKIHNVSQNWNKIQHFIESIANEFDKSQSNIIEEYRFIQNGWFECGFLYD